MTFIKQLGHTLLSLSFFVSAAATAAKNPVGQSADYNIDKDPKRTSSMLKSGSIQLSVPQEGNQQVQEPTYLVRIDYKFKVALMGDYNGKQETQIEKEYFTEEFIQNLREKGHYEGQYFKANHLGYGDAKNLDGKVYPRCDKILLYDIKEPANLNFFSDVLVSMLKSFNAERADIENLKVLTHVYVGVPVIGAVKVDVSGKYQGMDLKAGADYAAPKL